MSVTAQALVPDGRFTAQGLEAATVAFDALDRAVVGGQVLLDFSTTGIRAALLAPREWANVAVYLRGLLDREPVRSKAAYLAHRTVLASIAEELEQYARLGGIEVGEAALAADLRNARTKAEERQVLIRIEEQERHADRRHDELLDAQTRHLAAQVDADPEPEPARDPYLPGVVISDTDWEERGLLGPDSEPAEGTTDEVVDDPLAYL